MPDNQSPINQNQFSNSDLTSEVKSQNTSEVSGQGTNPKKFPTVLVIGLVTIILLLASALAYVLYQQQLTNKVSQVMSYEDCIAQPGSTIKETTPPSCIAADGQEYFQDTAFMGRVPSEEVVEAIPLNQEPVEITMEPQVNSTTNWQTYSSSIFKLSFLYPPTYAMDPPVESESLNLTFKEAASKRSFTVHAFNEYSPQNVQYILDQEPTKTVALNGTNWNFVYLEQGYESPPGGEGSSTFGYSAEINGRLYKVYLYNFEDEAAASQILSTFEFVD